MCSATAAASRSSARKPAEAAAPGAIVTFGVKPDHPATGYGYITRRRSDRCAGKVRKVAAFVEKPDAAKAQRFVEEGYLWNSGNFIFRADVMLGELQTVRAGDGERGARTPSKTRARISAFCCSTRTVSPERRKNRSITRSWSAPTRRR